MSSIVCLSPLFPTHSLCLERLSTKVVWELWGTPLLQAQYTRTVRAVRDYKAPSCPLFFFPLAQAKWSTAAALSCGSVVERAQSCKALMRISAPVLTGQLPRILGRRRQAAASVFYRFQPVLVTVSVSHHLPLRYSSVCTRPERCRWSEREFLVEDAHLWLWEELGGQPNWFSNLIIDLYFYRQCEEANISYIYNEC